MVIDGSVPAGAGSFCTGMPGGAGMVAFKDTEHPAEAAKVLDFFAREDIQKELMVRTRNVPAHRGLAQETLEYPDLSPQADGVNRLQPAAAS